MAIDDSRGRVVGFVNMLGDGSLAAFTPGLEVPPGYQGQGIGAEVYSVGYIHGPGVQSTADLCTPGFTSLRHPHAKAIVTAGGVIRLSVG